MSDLIDRQAAIEAVHKDFDECLVWDESGEITANEVERILDGLPSAQPTLYGYQLEHLAFIAGVMAKENMPPEKVIDILTDAESIATIILTETKRIIEQEVTKWI